MGISNREKALHVAQELFYHQGYLATSVDDIIAKAGLSKSNFYYHFKSKETLGLAVLEARKEDFQGVLANTLCHPALEPRERLLRFFVFLSEAQETRLGKGGCPFGNLVAEMAEHSERFRCQLSAMFCGLSSVIAELIAEGQQQGAFRRDVEPEALAALIVQTTQGMLLMTKCHKSADTVQTSGLVLTQLIETAEKT